mgnify:CR=1 FL=1
MSAVPPPSPSLPPPPPGGPPAATPPPVDTPALYAALFAAYPDALLLVDREGLIRLSNPAADTLLGYGAGELVGQTVDALVPDGIRPRHAQYREAYGRAPRPRPMGTQMDLVARRRDGSEVMVEIALSPLNADGSPYVVAAIRGIGAYPRVQQALARARYSEAVARLGRLAVDSGDPQRLFQRIPAEAAEALEVAGAVLYLLAPDGLSFTVAAGIDLLPDEVLGGSVPNDPNSVPGAVLARGAPVVVTDDRAGTACHVPEAPRAAGPVRALAVPLPDPGRTVGVLAVRARHARAFGEDEVRFLDSLSNLLAATLQRVQNEESVRHAQRMDTVGQLTGGIAHDFNNLLTVILGNLQVLEALPTVGDDDRARLLVEASARASRRAAELTAKLLTFSRRQMLSPTRVDVPAMVGSLADMLRRTLDPRIRIEVAAPPGLPACEVDAGQLESAVLNIAINARDAMPGGGTLRFTCRAEPDAPSADTPPSPGGFIVIAIADTGTGMSDAVRERAFEPFFTTKEAGRGTGLGLSTVYGFARQSRGEVTLDSAPGRGTTVSIYLPTDGRAAAPASDAPVAVDSSLPPGLKVLLVEDEPEVRAVAVRFLQGFGCEVLPCATAEQALARLTPDADFGLLLSDIELGAGLRGTDLAREAQRRLPGLRVLLVSGYPAQLIDTSETAPASWALLGKPYSRNALRHAMAEALAAPA